MREGWGGGIRDTMIEGWGGTRIDAGSAFIEGVGGLEGFGGHIDAWGGFGMFPDKDD